VSADSTVERLDPHVSTRRAPARPPVAVLLFGTPLRRLAAALLTGALLAVLGYWTYAGVRRSVEEVQAASLRAVLGATVATLQAWIDSKRAEAEGWAASPEVADAVLELVAAAGGGAHPAGLRTLPAHARFDRSLAGLLGERETVAYNAVTADGRIVAARAEGHVGARVGESVRADLAPVFGGQSRFIAPRPERERLPDVARPAFARPLVWFAAPVREAGGGVGAALAIGSYADARFTGILSLAWLGDTGSTIDAYAFDQTGLLLTRSRYVALLRSSGLLPPDAATAAFALQLRDPGVDLAAAAPAAGSHADAPFTRLAERALAARGEQDPARRRGTLLEPYRNYAGREVIGAWQWLPEYGIGIAVELARDEAFAPMRYLRTAFWTVFAGLVLAAAAALGTTFFVASLRRDARRLGPYHLEAKIEEGGMATVHRAVHALLKRPTAIKILKPHLASDELIARFEREVRLASRLEHPATVEIYDYGRTPEGTFYYAMEFIDGLTLAQLVEQDGPQPVGRIAHVLSQVCESLREAHGKGLIHRDVKPQNIMLCERGGESDVVKVLDWGLIKDVRAPMERDITVHARLLGTPVYMPPERVRDPGQADPLIDIYGLGAVAYFLVTGQRLFDAPNEFDLQRLVIEVDAPRASAAAPQPVPAALDELIARCLAKDPADRPQSVDELLAVFAALLRETPWTQGAAREWWAAWRAARPQR
jgi:serine/threonine-protein kinase